MRRRAVKIKHGVGIKRDAAYYQRKTSRPASGNTFLIVTEGKKTEPNYLIKLRERLHLKAADVVVVHPEGTDPITLFNEAMALRDQRAEEARKNSSKVPYDEIWLVYDLEKKFDVRRTQADRAKTLTKKENNRLAKLNIPGRFFIAESDPSFEFWLLLHCTDSFASLPDKKEAKKRLTNYIPDYKENWLPTPAFLEYLPTAVKRAQRCREHHKKAGGDCNPATAVDLLVYELNDASHQSFCFILPDRLLPELPA